VLFMVDPDYAPMTVSEMLESRSKFVLFMVDPDYAQMTV